MKHSTKRSGYASCKQQHGDVNITSTRHSAESTDLELDGEGRVLDLSVECDHATVVFAQLNESGAVRQSSCDLVAHLVRGRLRQAEVADVDGRCVILDHLVRHHTRRVLDHTLQVLDAGVSLRTQRLAVPVLLVFNPCKQYEPLRCE